MGTFGIQDKKPKPSPVRQETQFFQFINVYGFNSPSNSPKQRSTTPVKEDRKESLDVYSFKEEKKVLEQFHQKNIELTESLERVLEQCCKIDEQEEIMRIAQEKEQVKREEQRQAQLQQLQEAKLQQEKELEKAKVEEAKKNSDTAKPKPEGQAFSAGSSGGSTLQPQISQNVKSVPTKPKPINTQTPDMIILPSASEAVSPFLSLIKQIKEAQPALKKQNGNAIMLQKMKLNKAVGQLTPSQKQVVPVLKSLEQNLAQLATQNQSNTSTVTVYQLILYILAKKVVKQAETECAVHPRSVYPLALLVVFISKKHPQFWDILWGKLLWKSVFLQSGYPFPLLSDGSETTPQEIQKYKQRCKRKESESTTQFTERNLGMVRLFAAILQIDAIENKIGPQVGWVWLSQLLNLQYVDDITPLLVLTFLQVAGWKFQEIYKDQVFKN